MEGSLREILSPLFSSLQWLGLAPYKPKNGTLVLSRLRLTYTLILFIIYTYLFYYYYSNFSEEVDHDFAKAGTITFLSIFHNLGNTAVLILNMTLSYSHSKRILEQVSKIEKVDLELTKLGMKTCTKYNNNKIKNRVTILIVIVNILFTIIGEIATSVLSNNDQKILLGVIKIYPRLIIGTVNIIFYSISLITEKRFQMINIILSKKIIESNNFRKYPVQSDFSENIEHLVYLHKILVKATKEINSVFSLHFLLCITVNFILLIGDLHTSMFIIFFDFFSKKQKTLFGMLRNCIIYIFELFYLSKRTSDLCEQANRSKVLLLGIKIDIDKEDARNSVIASALKLMQNKLEITACRLFSIDNALLFSICGAASSYLFIMLQLDIGNINKQNQTNFTNLTIFTTMATTTLEI